MHQFLDDEIIDIVAGVVGPGVLHEDNSYHYYNCVGETIVKFYLCLQKMKLIFCKWL